MRTFRSLPALLPLLAVLVLSAAPARAEPALRYATGTLTLSAEPVARGAAMGRVLVAAEMAVLETRPGWLRVDLRGWRQRGADRVVYALPGKRILMAALAKPATEAARVLDTVTDPETGIAWQGVSVTGWVAADGVTADLQTVWQAAWDLFSTRCVACHQRRIPHKYTANQWVSLLKVMGPRTGLPKEQQRLILTYLQHHAKDTAR